MPETHNFSQGEVRDTSVVAFPSMLQPVLPVRKDGFFVAQLLDSPVDVGVGLRRAAGAQG